MSAFTRPSPGALLARHALLDDGWRHDVLFEWDAAGDLTRVEAGAAGAAPAAAGVERADIVLPGMVNLHSHAFQRVLAGLAERTAAGHEADSFWTWRELMYRVANRIAPDQMAAVAAQLYVDCLRHGYTSVCEFHYVQRAPGGEPYADPAETARQVAAAAAEAGIGLTLLPVLYERGGFGAALLRPEQARFRAGPDLVLRIVAALEPLRGPHLEVGAAPHSLRAAGDDAIRALARGMPAGRPLHIHVAEQALEVRQCVEATGRRPVEHLLQLTDIDARWCLVHATHLAPDEVARLAASGAVAGLCPTTEANLGDGLFPLPDYLAAGGRFGIGSDSHVSTSPVEELRWLEYGQRLRHERRNVAAGACRGAADGAANGDTAAILWQAALQGGARACGRRVGSLAPGRRADLLVLDGDHAAFAGIGTDADGDEADADELAGRFLFHGNDNLVRDVLAGGAWVVRGGRHAAQEAVARRYTMAVRVLRAAIS